MLSMVVGCLIERTRHSRKLTIRSRDSTPKTSSFFLDLSKTTRSWNVEEIEESSSSCVAGRRAQGAAGRHRHHAAAVDVSLFAAFCRRRRERHKEEAHGTIERTQRMKKGFSSLRLKAESILIVVRICSIRKVEA